MSKGSIVPSLLLDWDARDRGGVLNARVRGQTDWEDEVNATLRDLYVVAPCLTSRAVLDSLVETGKTVTIIPFVLQSWEGQVGKAPAKLNAGAVANDIPAATVRGKRSDELPDWIYRDLAAAPAGPQRDAILAKWTGTGKGSSSRLYFTPQDWAASGQTAGLNAADETLLHELVHCLRQAKGQEDPDKLLAPFPVLRGGEPDGNGNPTPTTALSQRYDTLEEFAAIVITNIYRSENGRPGLRQHHVANADGSDSVLSPTLGNPARFLTVWRHQLMRMQNELPLLCAKLAPITCSFNPIFELYASQNRFAPGTRRVLEKPWADPR